MKDNPACRVKHAWKKWIILHVQDGGGGRVQGQAVELFPWRSLFKVNTTWQLSSFTDCFSLACFQTRASWDPHLPLFEDTALDITWLKYCWITEIYMEFLRLSIVSDWFNITSVIDLEWNAFPCGFCLPKMIKLILYKRKRKIVRTIYDILHMNVFSFSFVDKVIDK